METKQDKWLYLFRHLPDLDDQPRPFQDSVFLQLFEIAEIANFSRTELDSYESSLKYYRDMNNVIDTSRMEGREEGRRLEKIEIARSLIGRLPVETISQATGLDVDEIEQLSRDLS